MSRKLFVLLAVAGLLCTMFIGSCKQKEKETTTEKKAKDKVKIAVVISTLNNPWFVVLGETAAKRARQLGYEARIFDSQNDTAKETDHFDNIIAAAENGSEILFATITRLRGHMLAHNIICEGLLIFVFLNRHQ